MLFISFIIDNFSSQSLLPCCSQGTAKLWYHKSLGYSSSVGKALAYCSSGPSSIPAQGEIFLSINGAPLHTAFHYQSVIILIWLKHCWKGCEIAYHPTFHLFRMLFVALSLLIGLNLEGKNLLWSKFFPLRVVPILSPCQTGNQTGSPEL